MKRYTGQQALYEAISRSRAKAKQGSILEKLRSEASKPEGSAVPQPSQTEPQPTPEQSVKPTPQELSELQASETLDPPVAGRELLIGPMQETLPEPAPEMTPRPVERAEPAPRPLPVVKLPHPGAPSSRQTWLRPRPVQFNEGRIEVSVPYYVGAIAGLVVFLVILTAFRLGQARTGVPQDDAGKQVQPAANKAGVPTNSAERLTQRSATADASQSQAKQPVAAVPAPGAALVKPQGDHLIVLAACKRQEDFEPVKRHFAENGIELDMVAWSAVRQVLVANGLNTRAVPSGDGYWIVVKDFFGNPETAGTDGSATKQKVIRVGALYRGKAPRGCESFGPHYFDDAYGIKIQ